MAPNQRAENKTQLRIWIEKDRLQLFKEFADASGLTMSTILTAFIIEKTNEFKRNQWKKNK